MLTPSKIIAGLLMLSSGSSLNIRSNGPKQNKENNGKQPDAKTKRIQKRGPNDLTNTHKQVQATQSHKSSRALQSQDSQKAVATHQAAVQSIVQDTPQQHTISTSSVPEEQILPRIDVSDLITGNSASTAQVPVVPALDIMKDELITRFSKFRYDIWQADDQLVRGIRAHYQNSQSGTLILDLFEGSSVKTMVRMLEVQVELTLRDIHDETGPTHVASCPYTLPDGLAWPDGFEQVIPESGIARFDKTNDLIILHGPDVTMELNDDDDDWVPTSVYKSENEDVVLQSLVLRLPV